MATDPNSKQALFWEGCYEEAEAELYEELGRDPTDEELEKRAISIAEGIQVREPTEEELWERRPLK